MKHTIRFLLGHLSLFLLVLITAACNGTSTRQQLEAAIRMDDVAAVRTLLTKTEDRREILSQHSTRALLLAFESNARTCFPILLEHGADSSEITDEGEPILATFARAGDSFWLQCALDSGADPNVANTERSRSPGKTPLMHAISADRMNNVKLLLAHHADVNHVSKYGSTPITMAVMSQKFEIGLELLKNGADPKTLDRTKRFSVIQYVASLPAQSIQPVENVEHFERLRAFLIEKGDLRDGKD